MLSGQAAVGLPQDAATIAFRTSALSDISEIQGAQLPSAYASTPSPVRCPLRGPILAPWCPPAPALPILRGGGERGEAATSAVGGALQSGRDLLEAWVSRMSVGPRDEGGDLLAEGRRAEPVEGLPGRAEFQPHPCIDDGSRGAVGAQGRGPGGEGQLRRPCAHTFLCRLEDRELGLKPNDCRKSMRSRPICTSRGRVMRTSTPSFARSAP